MRFLIAFSFIFSNLPCYAKTNVSTKSTNSIESKKVAPLYILTADERELIDEGEIGTTRYITSGVVGMYLGFGIGQAIQGRFREIGWKFLVAEAVSGSIILASAIGNVFGCAFTNDEECDERQKEKNNNNTLKAAVVVYITSRIWGAFDAWYGGYQHNKKVRRLKNKLANDRKRFSFSYILPTNDGLQAGYVFSF